LDSPASHDPTLAGGDSNRLSGYFTGIDSKFFGLIRSDKEGVAVIVRLDIGLQGKIVATYDYVDAKEDLLFQVAFGLDLELQSVKLTP